MTVQDFGSLVISEDLSQLERFFGEAPKTVAFHTRVMTFRWFARHRKDWAAGLTPKMRKLARRGAYLYRVEPAPRALNDSAIRSAIEADPDLDKVGGKGVLWSDTALVHERGGTVRPKSGRYLAVPIGKYRRMSGERRRAAIGDSPDEYNERNPDQPLFRMGRRRGGSRSVVLGRQTGKTLKSGKAQIEAVYLLKRSVRIPQTLGVQSSWDALAGYRASTLEEAVRRVVAEMERGIDKLPRRRLGGLAA